MDDNERLKRYTRIMPDSRHTVLSLNTVVPSKTKDRIAKAARNEENGNTSEEGTREHKSGN